MGAQKRHRFVALVLCAAAAATSATTQHASPRNAATTLRRGGSNAPSPLDDLRSSLKELRAQAPITHGLLHTLVVTFVAAQHPRTQGLLRNHAVCCRQALRRGRAHVLLSHAVVTHDPYQLVFSIFALVVMSKPAGCALCEIKRPLESWPGRRRDRSDSAQAANPKTFPSISLRTTPTSWSSTSGSASRRARRPRERWSA